MVIDEGSVKKQSVPDALYPPAVWGDEGQAGGGSQDLYDWSLAIRGLLFESRGGTHGFDILTWYAFSTVRGRQVMSPLSSGEMNGGGLGPV